ncbi:unnamed protein product, partial [Adineta ricciae]
LVLVATLQSKIANGKSYDEIKEFSSSLSERRKRKFNLSRLRHQLRDITKELDTVDVHPSMGLMPAASSYFGIKENPLCSTLLAYTDSNNVKLVIKAFFSQYSANEVDIQLLDALNTFVKNVKPNYISSFASFAQDANFQWTDRDIVQKFLDSLKAWLLEDALLKKQEKEKKDKEHTIDSEDEIDRPATHQSRQKTTLESQFENFLKAIVADLEYWNKTIKPVNQLISNNKDYLARFGTPPSFEKSGFFSSVKSHTFGSSNDDKAIEQTQHLIKIYYLAKSLLVYNQKLYIINAMMLKEQGKYSSDIYFDDSNELEWFLTQQNHHPVPSDSNQCEVYMLKHDLACAPFRYLLSLHLNIKLCSYRQISFQTLKNVEILNRQASSCETLWLQNERPPIGIAPDEEFRILVAAQTSIVSKYEKVLTAEMQAQVKRDFSTRENIYTFTSFFPPPLHGAVIEWIENYINVTQDQSLLHLLYYRLWVDGCHLSLFELQFIFTSVSSLKTLHHCDMKYL